VEYRTCNFSHVHYVNNGVMKPLHIAHFTNMYHPVINGVVRSVSDYKKAFTEMGHLAFVFAQHSDYQDEEAFVFRYPSLDLPIAIDIPAVIPVSLFVDKLLPSLKLDIIHSHHPIVLGLTAASKAQKMDLPLVFTFHSQYREYGHYLSLPQPEFQEFVQDMIHIWLGNYIRKCHHIVVPSQGMGELLEKEYGLQEGYSVIPSGIDLRPYETTHGDMRRAELGWMDNKVLISVGRMTQEKNWHTLLEACQRVMQIDSKIRLVIIGDGPEKSALMKYAQELGIASRVQFLGKIPFSEIPSYLKAADCFVYASVTETQGLVTLEAIAAGLPVAAVDAVGTSDIVRDGIEGLLTENDNATLAAAIKTLLAQPETMLDFSQAAVRRARTFSVENQARRLETVYYQAIEDHQRDKRVEIDDPTILEMIRAASGL
jgi:1,2-diacylglycerol 3-alpha-glucosyltransferase